MKITVHDSLSHRTTDRLDTDEVEGFPKTSQVILEVGSSRFYLVEHAEGVVEVVPIDWSGLPNRLIVMPGRDGTLFMYSRSA